MSETNTYSEKLAEFIEKNRPVSSEINFGQVKRLAELLGYNIIGNDPDLSVIYNPATAGSLRSGLAVEWKEEVYQNSIRYFPRVFSKKRTSGIEGNPQMLLTMSFQLPKIGFQESIVIDLPETAILIPTSFRIPNVPSMMYKKEFQKNTLVYIYS
jgi:hypothetical protein